MSAPATDLTHAETAILDRLEVNLDGARILGDSWRIRAALCEGAALVLAELAES